MLFNRFYFLAKKVIIFFTKFVLKMLEEKFHKKKPANICWLSKENTMFRLRAIIKGRTILIVLPFN